MQCYMSVISQLSWEGKGQYEKLEDNEAIPSKLRRNGFQPRILYTVQLVINCENKIKILLDI